MDLRGTDFNLLLPLRALLEERSVSRAAERMHMSQPALSAALRRLRIHFQDDLLVRRGNNYELSALAVQLLERAQSATLSMERVFDTQPGFDPTTTTRQFSIVSSDYCVAVLGGPLATLFEERAPQARLRFRGMNGDIVANFPDSLRDLDGALMPHGFVHHDEHLDLFVDRWVLLAADENSLVSDGALQWEDLSRLRWIQTFGGDRDYTPASKQMELLGVEPHVQVVTASFVVLPAFVAGSDRVALVQESLARQMLPAGGLKIVELPYDAVPLAESFWWNPIHNRDPGHLWLRSILKDAVAASSLAAPI